VLGCHGMGQQPSCVSPHCARMLLAGLASTYSTGIRRRHLSTLKGEGEVSGTKPELLRVHMAGQGPRL